MPRECLFSVLEEAKQLLLSDLTLRGPPTTDRACSPGIKATGGGGTKRCHSRRSPPREKIEFSRPSPRYLTPLSSRWAQLSIKFVRRGRRKFSFSISARLRWSHPKHRSPFSLSLSNAKEGGGGMKMELERDRKTAWLGVLSHR